MKTRTKGLLTLTIAAGGLLTALAFAPNSAWADPPGGWGRTYSGYAQQQSNYNNNGGFFGRAFRNNNNCNRPYSGHDRGRHLGWFQGNAYQPQNGWGGQRRVAWGGKGYQRNSYGHHRFW